MSNQLDLEEQEQIEQLKAFWAQYGSAITAVLVLVFVAFAGWNGYQYWQRQQAVQAAALYDEVERLAQGGDLLTAQRAFDELTKRFPRTAYAQQSALALAKTAVQANKIDVAMAALRWAAESGTDTALATVARVRWAGLLMESKDWSAAVDVLRIDPVDPELMAVALDRKGDALVGKGEASAAVESYKKALELSAGSSDVQRMVRIKLNALGVDVDPISKSSANEATAK